MDKFLQTIFIILCASPFVLFAQNTAYTTGFDSNSETDGWQQYRLGPTTDEFYTWEITSFGARSNPQCLSHNYPVGGSEVTDDWYVSPVFDFSKGGRIDSLWYFFSGFGTPMEGDTIGIYLIEDHQNPDMASKVTRLRLYDTAYYKTNTWIVDSLTIPKASDHSYIAFRYRTTFNWLDVKFDNLGITAFVPNSIDQAPNDIQLQLFPNPTNGPVSIVLNGGDHMEQITVYDLQGHAVCSTAQPAQLDLGTLPKGLYLVSIRTTFGLAKRVVQKL